MMISIFLQFNKFLDWFKDMLLQTVSFFGLAVSYIIGIGLTRIVAALVGKTFLPRVDAESQWQTVKYSDKNSHNLY